MHSADDTDRDWETLAQSDPYWSVLAVEEFRKKNITADRLKRFFESGTQHVDSIVKMLQWRFGAPPRFGTSLEFGCGVGRLLLPLASVSDRAIGLDVSPTMLDLCRRHAAERNIQNVELYENDDQFSKVQHLAGSVDLIVSFIVLQHIPPARGVMLVQRLLTLLRKRGYGFIHITCAAAIDSLLYEAGNVAGSVYKYYQRTTDGLVKLVGHPMSDGHIQMNHYNMNEILCLFYAAGIPEISVRFTNHANTVGTELYFQK